jgi:hypothetical protein
MIMGIGQPHPVYESPVEEMEEAGPSNVNPSE